MLEDATECAQSPLLFTPQVSKDSGKGKRLITVSNKKVPLRGILRTPSLPEKGPYNGNCSKPLSSTKKKVRLSACAEVLTGKTGLASPFESFSQMTPLVLKKRLSSKYSKRLSKNLSLDALLDPEIEPVWTDEMATPPKDNPLAEKEKNVKVVAMETDDVELEEENRKGVARALFKTERKHNEKYTDLACLDKTASLIFSESFLDGDENKPPSNIIFSPACKQNNYSQPQLVTVMEENFHLSPSIVKVEVTNQGDDISCNNDSLLDEVSKSGDSFISPPVISFNSSKKYFSSIPLETRTTNELTKSSGIGTLESSAFEKSSNVKLSVPQDNFFISPPFVGNENKSIQWHLSMNMKIMSQSTPIDPPASSRKFLSHLPISTELDSDANYMDKTSLNHENDKKLLTNTKKQNRKLCFDNSNQTADSNKNNMDKEKYSLNYLTSENILNELMDFNSNEPHQYEDENDEEEQLSPTMTSGCKTSPSSSLSVTSREYKSSLLSGTMDSIYDISESALIDDEKNIPTNMPNEDCMKISHTPSNERKEQNNADTNSGLIPICWKFSHQDDNVKNKTFLYPKAKRRRTAYLSLDNISSIEPGLNNVSTELDILKKEGKQLSSTSAVFIHREESRKADNIDNKKQPCARMDGLSKVLVENVPEQCFMNAFAIEEKGERQLEMSTSKLCDSNRDIAELKKKYAKLLASRNQQCFGKDCEQGKEVSDFEGKMKPIDEDGRFGNSSMCGFPKSIAMKVEISNKCLGTDKKVYDNDDTSVTIKTKESSNFCGFQTGLGKKVEISKKSLKAAKKVFDNDDLSVTIKTKESSNFCGFQTGLGKKVEISKKSLKVAEKVFDNDDLSVIRKAEELSNFCGFQTGLGKKVEISMESLKAAKNVFENDDTSVTMKAEESSNFCGFQTGLGKKVEISMESLLASKRVFDKDDTSVKMKAEESSNFCGFQTGLGKKVEISKKSLKVAEKVFDNDDLSVIRKAEELSNFCGFQTGLGKKVEISKKSLKAAKKLFDNDDTSVTMKAKESSNFCGFQTGLGKKVEISMESLKAAKNVFENDDTSVTMKAEESSNFCGFQTGLGKKVEISMESLLASKRVFDKDDTSVKMKAEESLNFCGFQTGFGKKVEISKKSLKAAKKVFDNDDLSVTIKTKESSNFCGFQTGLGKKVEISKKSLKAAEKVFDNDDLSVTMKAEELSNFCGFQTGLGKKVEISKKSLKAAKKLFDNDDTSVTLKAKESSNFCGFQTGLGKKVEISMKSLKAAKNVFENDDTSVTMKAEESSKFCDFETGLEKKVETSIEFLEAANLEASAIFNNHEVLASTSGAREPGGTMLNKENSYLKVHQNVDEPSKDIIAELDVNADCESNSDIFLGKEDFNFNYATPYCPRTLYRNKRKTLCTSPAMYKTDRISSFNIPMIARYSTPEINEPDKSHNVPADGNQKSMFVTPFKFMKSKSTDEVCKRKGFSYCPFRRKRVKVNNDDICKNIIKETTQKNGRLYTNKSSKSKSSLAEFVNYVTPQQLTVKELHEYGINDSLININSHNALMYAFNAGNHFSETVVNQKFAVVGDNIILHFNDHHNIGVEEFKRSFLNCQEVDSKLINESWIDNHYRWIIWKLASYERRYPEQFANRCLTPSNVMYHLKYRYDKEIDHAQRSCLKLIYERDDVSSRRMVLCVSNVDLYNSSNKENVVQDKKVVELTDGWYPIKAMLDQPLTQFLDSGRISIGTKLLISGAQLIGSDQGCSPLESPDTLMLQLFTNSTRRASWEVKLGFQTLKLAFCVPLKSLYTQGGVVGCVNITILRKYPMQWMEKTEGRCTFRKKNVEEIVQKKYLEEKQKKMEDVYSKVQKKFEESSTRRERKCKKNRNLSSRCIQRLRYGKEICEVLESSADPSSVEDLLSASQKELAADYRRSQADEQQTKMNTMFNSEWKTILQDFPERSSIELQRYRVVDNYEKAGHDRKDFILTVWKPTSDIIETWNEGTSLSVFQLNVAQSRCIQASGHVQLSTTNNTKYQINQENNAMFTPRHVVSIEDLYCTPSIFYNEIDLVGYVIRIVPSKAIKGCEQSVYICDDSKSFLAVKFWNGMQVFGMESTIQENSLIALTSLSWPKYVLPHRKKILPASFTDMSAVFRNPKEVYLKDAFQTCRRRVQETPTFFNDVNNLLDDILRVSSKSVAMVSQRQSLVPVDETSNPNQHIQPMQHHYGTLPQNINKISEHLPSEKLQARHKLQIKKHLSLERYKEPPSLSLLPNKDVNVVKSQFRPHISKR